MKKYKLITIEGNLGAGKTSLAQLLAQEYDAHLILEEFWDNPFLPKFYQDADRYALHTELHFLLDRCEQLQKILNTYAMTNCLNVSDYLFVKSLIFAKLNLDKAEYQLFERIFYRIFRNLPQPELLVYLYRSPTRLLENIHARGRSFEQSITAEYLKSVEAAYTHFFRKNPQLKVLRIHADDVDFIDNPIHYQQIINAINQQYEIGINELVL